MARSAQTSLARSVRLWASLAERLLERFVVRVALSVAIIVSLIPLPWVERLDLLFFAVFATEFGLRVFVIWALPPEREAERLGSRTGLEAGTDVAPEHRTRFRAIALLVVDLVALLSFVPLPVRTAGARWLRLFRLTRMLLLVGYWAPLVRDLWSILARRERARQLVLMGFVVGALSFTGAVVLFHLGGEPVDVTGDGVVDDLDHSFFALLWWSFRQVQDPGNMLASPVVVPVVMMSLVLTVFGLFLVSFLIGLGTDVVHELLELSRLRPPGLRGHTVVVNIGPSTQRLLHELRRYYRKLFPTEARALSRAWFSDLRRRGFSGPRYVIVGRDEDPPDFLRQPELHHIVYRERSEDEEELIKRADLLVAKRIVLLADSEDDAPDAETIRTLLTLVERVRDRERHRDMLRLLGRRRVVIAEILDESNVPAAQAALSTGTDSFRGFVVPTEKLLALFFASVVRRPGLGDLLEELLTSRGHEIYTCFFQTDGLGFTMARPPRLGPGPCGAMDALLRRGLLPTGSRGTVIPVGLLRPAEPIAGGRDFDVAINPATRAPEDAVESYRGFVAIADNFGSVRALAEELPLEPGPDDAVLPAPAAEAVRPRLERSPRLETGRVLVCGFRAGSVYMLEELFRSDPGGEILVLVEDEAAEARARDALDAHTQMVHARLLDGRHGVFEEDPEGSGYLFRLDSRPDGAVCRMQLAVVDWMASRYLVDLPLGFGHVVDLDAIVFVASDRASADKRTTTALLKLEQLFAGRGATERPRVVAEVIDGRLAARLEQRCLELGIADVRVFSIQELRAYFLFQSVVVPGFDTVYAELLGSWGQSFVHQRVVGDDRGVCSFGELAFDLRRRGEVLIAVELAEPSGRPRLCVAPGGDEPGARFDLADLRGVWVIAPDGLQTDAGADAARSAAQ